MRARVICPSVECERDSSAVSWERVGTYGPWTVWCFVEWKESMHESECERASEA